MILLLWGEVGAAGELGGIGARLAFGDGAAKVIEEVGPELGYGAGGIAEAHGDGFEDGAAVGAQVALLHEFGAIEGIVVGKVPPVVGHAYAGAGASHSRVGRIADCEALNHGASGRAAHKSIDWRGHHPGVRGGFNHPNGTERIHVDNAHVRELERVGVGSGLHHCLAHRVVACNGENQVAKAELHALRQ